MKIFGIKHFKYEVIVAAIFFVISINSFICPEKVYYKNMANARNKNLEYIFSKEAKLLLNTTHALV